ALHEAIFSTPVAEALEGIDTLRVHAGGALASLPFAVLQAADEGGEPRWLIDRFALVSLSDLAPRSPEQVAGESPARFLAVAAPLPFPSGENAGEGAVGEIAQCSLRGGIDAAALGRLPALERRRGEPEAIAGVFGAGNSRLLLGADASETGLLDAPLGEATILLFATHGLISGEIEGVAEPALVLSPPQGPGPEDHDGLLTASEIAMLELTADWVILSACNSP